MIEGRIKIATDVVAAIAGTAALQVKGVVALSSNTVISEILSKRSPSKGVTVNVSEDSCSVSVSVVVIYGIEIHAVAVDVQESVNKAVTQMTGLKVSEVNVLIEGISVEKERKAQSKKNEHEVESI
ncbi:MAG: Asp23/Gls24 family envelope stress response protein [Fusobacteria bacterium]|nr:Asp23/Gls24 family envelope stress response protein [Fusobacteriota bacterium]